MLKAAVILCGCIISYSCSPPGIVTTWRVQQVARQQYDKIMTVGIISKNDSLRPMIENSFVKAIEELNYHAVPAIEEFGPGGLAGLEEANTYIKLCDNGIDAVMTIALIDGTKEEYQKPGNMFTYPASHYYNRIWNYKNIQVKQGREDNTNKSLLNFWEVIIFDLNTLEAVCVIQTKSFTEIPGTGMADDFAKQIIRQLRKEKILNNRKNHSKALRPF